MVKRKRDKETKDHRGGLKIATNSLAFSNLPWDLPMDMDGPCKCFDQ